MYIRLIGRNDTPSGIASWLSGLSEYGPGEDVGVGSARPFLEEGYGEDIECLHNQSVTSPVLR